MNTEPFSVEGLRVLVTGSTRGIGAAIAKAFVDNGATVWIHGRSQSACAEAASRIGAIPIAADLEKDDAPRQIAFRILEESGPLDTLIHNAGFESYMPIENYDMALFDRILRVNLRVPVELTHQLLPALRRSRNASIINVTSIHDTTPSPFNSAYSMAKAGLAMFTKWLCIELGPEGIRANTLVPGAIETDMNREIIDKTGRRNWAEWIPSGGVGQVEDLSGAALFLASKASRYMNGASLLMDGGYSQNLLRYRIRD